MGQSSRSAAPTTSSPAGEPSRLAPPAIWLRCRRSTPQRCWLPQPVPAHRPQRLRGQACSCYKPRKGNQTSFPAPSPPPPSPPPPLIPLLSRPAPPPPLVGSAQTSAAIASGVVITVAGPAYVSYQGAVYPFKTMTQLANDGFGGTAAVPTPHAGGLPVILGSHGSRVHVGNRLGSPIPQLPRFVSEPRATGASG